MDAAEVKQLLETGIDGAEARVAGAGDRFDISVIADHFDGLSPVRRQQAVYACINHLIAEGSIHAVNIYTYTRDQWQTAERRGLV
jgi:acid stress-induced BolA-like protein IbaG/YrbA